MIILWRNTVKNWLKVPEIYLMSCSLLIAVSSMLV